MCFFSDITAISWRLSAYFFSLCKSQVYGRRGGGTTETTAKKCLGLYLHIYSFAFFDKTIVSRVEVYCRASFPSLSGVWVRGVGGGGCERKSAKIVGKRALQFQLYIPHKLMIQAAFSWFIFCPQPWPGSLVALLTRSVLGQYCLHVLLIVTCRGDPGFAFLYHLEWPGFWSVRLPGKLPPSPPYQVSYGENYTAVP